MNIIRDPETGFYNSCHAGTHAVGPRRGLISFVTPHSHVIMGKYRDMGLDAMPIAFVFGVPGFFSPRVVPPFLAPDGSIGALSFYDTQPLKATLEELVDFALINRDDGVRLSLGAVDLRTGNSIYFDSKTAPIGAEHVLASGALPPGFPPVEIDGERYWDGGLFSNTPLQYVLDYLPRRSRLTFQVDVFHAHGRLPSNLDEVTEREKDLRYSSRTKIGTDAFRKQKLAPRRPFWGRMRYV